MVDYRMHDGVIKHKSFIVHVTEVDNHLHLCKWKTENVIRSTATNLFKLRCFLSRLLQNTFITNMLNKNSLAVKKVRGQSEATMAISDQNI